jgi:hypothetical protein
LKHRGTIANTRVGSWLFLAGLWAALADCKSRRIPEGQCEFNGDCANGQVCANLYCRAQCRGIGMDADCAQVGAGWHCRSSGMMSVFVCLPPDQEGFCQYSSQCHEPYVCTNGICGVQCREDRDCLVISLDGRARCMPDGSCSFRDGGVASDAAGDGPSASDTPDGGSPADAPRAEDSPAGDGPADTGS